MHRRMEIKLPPSREDSKTSRVAAHGTGCLGVALSSYIERVIEIRSEGVESFIA